MDYIISFKILEIKAKILKCSYKFAQNNNTHMTHFTYIIIFKNCQCISEQNQEQAENHCFIFGQLCL